MPCNQPGASGSASLLCRPASESLPSASNGSTGGPQAFAAELQQVPAQVRAVFGLSRPESDAADSSTQHVSVLKPAMDRLKGSAAGMKAALQLAHKFQLQHVLEEIQDHLAGPYKVVPRTAVPWPPSDW